MRMGLEVDLAPAAVGHVCVALRRPEVGVPQHLLDGPEIRAAFEQVRRERVAQQMGVHTARLEAGSIGELAEDEERACSRQRATSRIEKELRSIAAVEMGPTEREVATNGLGGGPAQRYEPFLRALSDDTHDALLERDAVLLEADRLGHAEPGAIQQLDEGAVTQGSRHRPVRRVDQAFRLCRRQRAR